MDNGSMAQLFKALGDENRLLIVELIAENEEICACKLLDELEITQPTLSHHMKLLRDSKLIRARKEGRWMHYSLDDTAIDGALTFLEELRGS